MSDSPKTSAPATFVQLDEIAGLRRAANELDMAVGVFIMGEASRSVLDAIVALRDHLRALAGKAAQAGKGEPATSGYLTVVPGSFVPNPEMSTEVPGLTKAEAAEYLSNRQQFEAQAGKGEAVGITAVGRIGRLDYDDGSDEPYVDWLVEGGIYEVPHGSLLLVANKPITDDEGHGEVYTTPQPQPVPAIDYEELIKAAVGKHGYRQGTAKCVAFKHGAEWLRSLNAAACKGR